MYRDISIKNNVSSLNKQKYNSHNQNFLNFYSYKVSFGGELEDKFFKSIKNGDEYTAAGTLNKINFNITEIDNENGNNVFHYILQDNSEMLWSKLNTLLKNIVSRVAPNKIEEALSAKNNENKTPFECAVDSTFLKKVQKDLNLISNKGNNSSESLIKSGILSQPQQSIVQTNEQTVSANVSPLEDAELVGNETYDISLLNDDMGFDMFSNLEENIDGQNFPNVIGQEAAKAALEEYIMTPVQNKKPILINGILLYGKGNNGKTYLVEELSKTLDKEIIGTKKILNLLEKQDLPPEELEKLLNRYIISISIDDYRDIDIVLDYVYKNFKNTGNQTILYIDELAKLFQSDFNINGRYSSRDIPEFMRKFDNFALKGGVLIGTTNDIDLIQSDILRSNRFQKKVELKFPGQNERKQILEKYLNGKLVLNDNEYSKIIKKTAGFSYGDLTVISKLLDAKYDEIDFEVLNKIVQSYAKENQMGELSDEGTTTNYDSAFLRRKPVKINFNDVAGMDEVKKIFDKTVVSRLKPEVAQRFRDNKRPIISTNFLLYGPPGTGKTFIVEALSGESHIPMYKIDASSFMDKFVGESEKNLRRIFNQLETKYNETGEYSILFMDEANKILGRRDGLNKRDSEYVEQLLQYIDNSFERGIITITATNYKDKMDDAVLSRLGQQIMIGYPDLETIKSLVKLQFKNIKCASNITDDDIAIISRSLRGFGSREIKQMITSIIDENLQGENKELTLQDIKNGISLYAQSHELPAINERNRTAAYDKFIKRLEIRTTDPQSLDDIGGMQDVKENLMNAVMSSSLKPEIEQRYKANKVKEQNGILLYGKPGCGKTYLMKALAAEMDLPIYEFKLSNFGSKWAHETTENIGKVFNQLKEKYQKTGEKSILMLDEFEDIASKREGEINSSRIEETNALLKEISDAARNGIIVVAATNNFAQIDDAMKRPGRFVCIEVTPPDFKAREDIIKKSLAGREIAEKLFEDENNFSILASETEDFVIADITETINKCVKTSIDNYVDKLTLDDLQKAFKQRKEEKIKESQQ